MKLKFTIKPMTSRPSATEGRAFLGARLVGYVRLKVRGRSAHVEWAQSLDESHRGTATALLKHMLTKLRSVRRLLVIPVTDAGARFTAKLVAQQKRLKLTVAWGLPEQHEMNWRGTGRTTPRRQLTKLIGQQPQRFSV